MQRIRTFILLAIGVYCILSEPVKAFGLAGGRTSTPASSSCALSLTKRRSSSFLTQNNCDDDDNDTLAYEPQRQVVVEPLAMTTVFSPPDTTSEHLLLRGPLEDLSTTRQLLSHFGAFEKNFAKDNDIMLPSSSSSLGTPSLQADSSAEQDRIRNTTISSLVTAAVLLATGTYAMSCVLGDLLSHWEWIQAWKYTWPFGIGALYMVLNSVPLWWNNKDYEDPSYKNKMVAGNPVSVVAESMMGETFWERLLVAVLGLGVIIGGAYDSWMPVYMTGPNIVTAAGIGQDAAVGLFGWTFWRMVALWPSSPSPSPSSSSSSSSSSSPPAHQGFLLQVLLLAELYKLGEGAFDELFFSKFTC
jgi:hypothetical protein